MNSISEEGGLPPKTNRSKQMSRQDTGAIVDEVLPAPLTDLPQDRSALTMCCNELEPDSSLQLISECDQFMRTDSF